MRSPQSLREIGWCIDHKKKEIYWCGNGRDKTDIEVFYRAIKAYEASEEGIAVDTITDKGGAFSTSSPAQVWFLNDWRVRPADEGRLRSSRATLLASNTPGARQIHNPIDLNVRLALAWSQAGWVIGIVAVLLALYLFYYA
jgi:hypothetical protein